MEDNAQLQNGSQQHEDDVVISYANVRDAVVHLSRNHEGAIKEDDLVERVGERKQLRLRLHQIDLRTNIGDDGKP